MPDTATIRLPRRHHRDRPCLCRRHPVLHQPLAAGHGTAAAEAMERPGRPTSSIRRTPSISRSQPGKWHWNFPKRPGGGSPGAKAPTPGCLALCGCACSPCASRLSPLHARPEEWCLIEWPADEPEPTKYFLSTCPRVSAVAPWSTPPSCVADELDYQDLKQELGLGHYEGRGWRGFHHHATLCIAAYGFPDLRKGSDSPLRTTQRLSYQRTSPIRRLSTPRLPRSDLSVTCRTRFPLSGSRSPAPSLAHSRAAPAANGSLTVQTCDTVRLAGYGGETPHQYRRACDPWLASAG